MKISNSNGIDITVTGEVFRKVDDFFDDFTTTISCHCSVVNKLSAIWSQFGPALIRFASDSEYPTWLHSHY